MSKHTPGPWWRDDDGFIAAGFGDTYVTVASPNCTLDLDIDEREANARLIAGAPSMRLALQAIADAKPGPDTDFSKFAAILVTIARVELASLEGAK